jgi:hypothetical protein
VGAILMSLVKIGTLVATGVALGACAIRPLPEQVTGVDTATIVKKTRCEARDAIVQGRVNWVHSNPKYQDVVDEDTLLAYQSKFDARMKYFLDYFSRTGIVYSFALDGTESGGATFTADVVRPLVHSTTTLTPTAGDTLSREDIRAFTISDNFSELLRPEMRKRCNELFPQLPGPNYQYPIVGRIGVDEIVHTFIELTFSGLGSQEDPSKGVKYPDTPSASAPIAMVDTVNFTTTVGVGLTAKAVFSPPGTDWRLADATLPLSAMRTDKHQVIIGLALSGPPSPPGVLVTRRAGQPMAVAAFLANANTPRVVAARAPRPGTGEAVALDAVNAQILRFEVPKSLIVVP